MGDRGEFMGSLDLEKTFEILMEKDIFLITQGKPVGVTLLLQERANLPCADWPSLEFLEGNSMRRH